MKAIETHYKGYRFRSRLEARWAVFFDTLGVLYEYEKEGFDLGDGVLYLPDFWLPEYDLWVEVKGAEISIEDRTKVSKLSDKSGKDVVLVGTIPEPGSTCYVDGWTGVRKSVADLDEAGILLQCMLSLGDNMCDGWGIQTVCPICAEQSDCVHFCQPIFNESDSYGAWSGRGGALRIPMWCEAGHEWDLRLGFHKGQTYIAIENATTMDHDFLLWLAGSPDRRDSALQAARSARFEHGETPG